MNKRGHAIVERLMLASIMPTNLRVPRPPNGGGGSVLQRLTQWAVALLRDTETYGAAGIYSPMLPPHALAAAKTGGLEAGIAALNRAAIAAGILAPADEPQAAQQVLDISVAVAGVTSCLLAWLSEGLPRVELGHRHAALLCATRTDRETASELCKRLPWAMFLVTVPDGMIDWPFLDGIPMANDPKPEDFDTTKVAWASAPLAHVMVVRSRNQRTQTDGLMILLVPAEDRYPLELWWVGENGELAACDGMTASITDEVSGVPIDSHPGIVLVSRLLLGVLAEFSEHRPALRAARERGEHRPRVKSDGTTVPVTFKLCRDVKVDVRAELKAFAQQRRHPGSRRGACAPSVRFKVQGYWRNQPHGPRNTLRRMQWIPSGGWHGPEGAPLAVRAHVLVDGAELREVSSGVCPTPSPSSSAPTAAKP